MSGKTKIQWADERIPLLLQTPAAKRFVSYEPALGPIDFTFSVDKGLPWDEEISAILGFDWLVCGGESGPRARPMQVEWARSTRDQFFYKQGIDDNGQWCKLPFLDGKQWREVPE